MKHLKTRILSAILSAAVITSSLPFAAGAEASTEYDAVLYNAEFESDSLSGLTFKKSETVPLKATVVSASDEAAADAEAHGGIAKYYKGAEAETNEDGSVNKGMDGYIRINYEDDEDPIDDKFINNPEALRKVKASIDVMTPTEGCSFNMRFYKKFSKSTEGTKGDNLAVFGSNGNISFMGSSKTVKWEPGIWYTMEFVLDFEADTYSASVNGEACVENLPFVNLTECITSFGIVKPYTTKEWTIYMDNISFAVPKEKLVPENTNTVWENDFDDIAETDGALPSGSLDGEAAELSEIDYRPEKCAYSIIKEDNGNQYFYFVPNNSAMVANSGNRLDGYFAASNQETRNSDDTDSGTNTADVDPYPIDVNPIDKLRLDMSVKLDSFFKTGIKTYFRGTYKELHSVPMDLLIFNADGTMKLGRSVTLDKTYTPGEWLDITMWIDYETNVVTCLIDGEFAGCALFDTIPYFHQIRMRTSPSENSGITDISTMGMSIDNIRYSTTYNRDYIDRKHNSSYSTEMAKLDFEEFAPSTGLYRGDNIPDTTIPYTYAIDSQGTRTDNITDYYINSSTKATAPVTVLYDGDRESNVACINESGKLFGVSRLNTRDIYTYDKYGVYPKLIKAEVEMMKTSGAAYIYMGSINEESRLVTWFSANKIGFENGAGTRTTDNAKNKIITREDGTWIKVTMYFDYASGKYTVFLDDELIGKYTIPSGTTNPELLTVKGSVAGAVYVDNITVSTIEPYSGSIIAEYKDNKQETQLGYVLSNTDTENAYEYGVYCAKYAADGTLENINLASGSVAAGTTELKNLEKVEATDGGYYTYFIWEDLTSLKPLFESKTIR